MQSLEAEISENCLLVTTRRSFEYKGRLKMHDNATEDAVLRSFLFFFQVNKQKHLVIHLCHPSIHLGDLQQSPKSAKNKQQRLLHLKDFVWKIINLVLSKLRLKLKSSDTQKPTRIKILSKVVVALNKSPIHFAWSIRLRDETIIVYITTPKKNRGKLISIGDNTSTSSLPASLLVNF